MCFQKEISYLSKYLSAKTQKPEEKLLMNRTEGFRLKNEIKTTIDLKDSKQTKYGFQNDWVISLRKTPEINLLYRHEKRNTNTTNSYANMNTYFNPLKTLTNDNHSPTQSNFNNSGNNFFKNNFSNHNDNMFNYVKCHKSYDNEIRATIKDNMDKDDSNNNYCQIRKPNTNPISMLDNFTQCQSVEKKLLNLRIKKEDFNKINNLQVNNLILKVKKHFINYFRLKVITYYNLKRITLKI